MAKRFTDTDKWKKPFIRTMKAPYKLLWLYILDECDHAGIWQIDLEVAEIKIGEKLKLDEALNQFGSRVIKLEDKLFIPDFINFQYGPLNPSNRVHKSVLDILSLYDLTEENLKIKDLISPLQGAKDKDKDKDKEKDKDKDRESIFLGSVWDNETMNAEWCRWIEYKRVEFKDKYKSKETEKQAGRNLWELSKGNQDTAVKIINKSIANHYKGLFELKENGTTQQPTTRLGEGSHDGKEYKL
jgi:hypothetical protein